MNRIISTLAALSFAGLIVCLSVAPAGAASTPRSIHPALIGDEPAELLLATNSGTLDASGECLPLWVNNPTVACDGGSVNEIIWPHNAIVTSLRVATISPGDSGYQCDFFIEVAGVAAAGQITTVLPVDQAFDTIFKQNQILKLAEGDLVGIRVDDGTATCPGTADPIFQVFLYGFWDF